MIQRKSSGSSWTRTAPASCPDPADPDPADPDQADPDQADPDRADPDQADQARPRTVLAGGLVPRMDSAMSRARRTCRGFQVRTTVAPSQPQMAATATGPAGSGRPAPGAVAASSPRSTSAA